MTGTPEELFSALQEAASTYKIGLNNVKETLKGWTEQPGYPLITVINSDYNITNSTTAQYTIFQVRELYLISLFNQKPECQNFASYCLKNTDNLSMYQMLNYLLYVLVILLYRC